MMAPTAIKKTKKSMKVLSICDKIIILNLIEKGEEVAVVARKFEGKEKIRISASHLGQYFALSKVNRNLNMSKMEELLMIWMQDLIYKNISVGTRAIRAQPLEFYKHLEKKNATNESIVASKGWFEKFKNRFPLHNVKFTGI